MLGRPSGSPLSTMGARCIYTSLLYQRPYVHRQIGQNETMVRNLEELGCQWTFVNCLKIAMNRR